MQSMCHADHTEPGGLRSPSRHNFGKGELQKIGDPCIALHSKNHMGRALKQGPFDDPFWKRAVLFGGPEKGPPNLENLPSVKEQDEERSVVVDSCGFKNGG